MVSLAQKLKRPKPCQINSTNTLQLYYAKNGSEKELIFGLGNDIILKIGKNGHHAKSIALKNDKNNYTSTLELFYANNSRNESIKFLKIGKNGHYAKVIPFV